MEGMLSLRRRSDRARTALSSSAPEGRTNKEVGGYEQTQPGADAPYLGFPHHAQYTVERSLDANRLLP